MKVESLLRKLGPALILMGVIAAAYFGSRVRVTSANVNFTTTGSHPAAPEFSLVDLSGNKLDLSRYQGKVVVLDFWATWCSPCRSEIPHFIDWQNRYGSEGLQVIGISMDDDIKPVQEFYQQFKMNYPVAVGNSKLAATYGGILGLPVTFVIGRDGRIYAKHIGETEPAVFEREIKTLLRTQQAQPVALIPAQHR